MPETARSGDPFLATEIRDHVAYITFNRPERLNTYELGFYSDMGTKLRELKMDDDVRVVVLAGTGRAFSVGSTHEMFEALTTDEAVHAENSAAARAVINELLEFEKPIISAVNGLATGGVCVYALLSDICIVEEQAKLAVAQLRLGLPAGGDGSILAWPLSVGLMAAKRYMLTGDWVSADEAFRLGLVSEVVRQGASLDRAEEFARRFVSGPQGAIRGTKRTLNRWLAWHRDVYDFAGSLLYPAFTTPEVKNALADVRAGGQGAMPPEEVVKGKRQ